VAALGRTEEAVEFLREAKELGASADAALELARALQSLGKDQDALAALDEIMAANPEASLLRAEIHARLGRIEDALADHDTAIRAATAGRDIAFRRKGRYLLDLGRPKEALAAFDAAIGLRPADPEAWVDAALAWGALGQPSRARKMLDEALRLDPDHVQARRLRSETTAAD
jgi:tetratricopeptide (TPR) repeat protein